MKLGVNIDHIAVLREARKCADPSPIDALYICAIAGAQQITIHLREDRRHINDTDAKEIVALSKLPVNMECAVSSDIIDIVCRLAPMRATLVPEKREEVTTEGGLDVSRTIVGEVTKKLREHEIAVSYFIDPTPQSVEAAQMFGADCVEFHTGRYANLYASLYANLSKTPHALPEFDRPRSWLEHELQEELRRITICARMAKEAGISVAAGHGLNYQNVSEIAAIHEIEELNIGQSIIARSIFVGLERAIQDMRDLLR